MGSFNGATFAERGTGSTFVAPPAAMSLIERQVPNNGTTLKAVGADLVRFNLVVRVTKNELLALYDQVLEDGSLVYGYETCNALLEGVDSAAEQGRGFDVYFATLRVIRL